MLTLLPQHTTDISVYHEQLHSDFTTTLVTPVNKIFLYKKISSKGYIHVFV